MKSSLPFLLTVLAFLACSGLQQWKSWQDIDAAEERTQQAIDLAHFCTNELIECQVTAKMCDQLATKVMEQYQREHSEHVDDAEKGPTL